MVSKGTSATADRAGREPSPDGLGHTATIASAVRWLRKTARKCRRNPYYADLRLIAHEHRHLYKKRMRSAESTGAAIGILLLAWDRKHFRSQRSPSPLPPRFYSDGIEFWWERRAQAIEARGGETGTGSTEGESAVRKDAPNNTQETPNGQG